MVAKVKKSAKWRQELDEMVARGDAVHHAGTKKAVFPSIRLAKRVDLQRVLRDAKNG